MKRLDTIGLDTIGGNSGTEREVMTQTDYKDAEQNIARSDDLIAGMDMSIQKLEDELAEASVQPISTCTANYLELKKRILTL
jgi:hypothetical protein